MPICRFLYLALVQLLIMTEASAITLQFNNLQAFQLDSPTTLNNKQLGSALALSDSIAAVSASENSSNSSGSVYLYSSDNNWSLINVFIHSLPIFFAYIQLGTPLDLLLIALLVYIVVYLTMPIIEPVKEQECIALKGLSFYRYLLYSWLGSLKLWVVFWPFFILLNVSLYFTDRLAMQGNFTVSSWDEVHFILLTPAIFWTLCRLIVNLAVFLIVYKQKRSVVNG
jgi:hypothetical protein